MKARLLETIPLAMLAWLAIAWLGMVFIPMLDSPTLSVTLMETSMPILIFETVVCIAIISWTVVQLWKQSNGQTH